MSASSSPPSGPAGPDVRRDTSRGVNARITEEPLAPGEVLQDVGAPEDGARLLFLGVVRNHNDGRAVSGLHYEAYREMAESVLTEIAREGAEILGTDRITVVHRVGDLEVGEVSVAVAVSSPHRAQAYDASRYVMREIKERLPVWKKERYVEGESAWVGGTRPAGPRNDGEEEGE